MGCGSSRSAYRHDRRAYHGVAIAPLVSPITPGSAAFARSAASHTDRHAWEDHAYTGTPKRGDFSFGLQEDLQRRLRRQRIAEWRQNTLGIVRETLKPPPPPQQQKQQQRCGPPVGRRYDHLTKFGSCQLGMVDEMSTCTHFGEATPSDGATRSADCSTPSSLSTSGITTFVNHAASQVDKVHLLTTPSFASFACSRRGGEVALMYVSAGTQRSCRCGRTSTIHTKPCAVCSANLAPLQLARPLQRYTLSCCDNGHAHRVKLLLLVPQADVLLSCSTVDRHVTAYHLQLRTEVGRLVGHDDVILDGATSPDGRVVATASRDGTAILWELPSCQQRRSLPHPGAVHACRFSAKGAEVATVCADGRCRVWTWTDTDVVHTLVSVATGFDGALTTLAYSMGDKHLLAGGAANTVFVCDRQRFSEPAALFTCHRSSVLSVDASLTQPSVVVSADERSLYVWRCDTMLVLHCVEVEQWCVPRRRVRHTSAADAVPLSCYWTAVRLVNTQLGLFVVAGASDRCVHLFQIKDGVPVQDASATASAESTLSEVLSLSLSSSLSAADGVLAGTVVLGDTCGNRHVLTLS